MNRHTIVHFLATLVALFVCLGPAEVRASGFRNLERGLPAEHDRTHSSAPGGDTEFGLESFALIGVSRTHVPSEAAIRQAPWDRLGAPSGFREQGPVATTSSPEIAEVESSTDAGPVCSTGTVLESALVFVLIAFVATSLIRLARGATRTHSSATPERAGRIRESPSRNGALISSSLGSQ